MLRVLRLSIAVCLFAFLSPIPASAQSTLSTAAPRVTIQAAGWGTAGRSQIGKDTTFAGKDGASVVTASGLQEALRWGNVTVVSDGDIVVDASLTWSSNSRLTLNARRSIIVRKGATIASKGAGSLSLRAGMVTLDGTINYAGSTGKVSILASADSGTVNSLKSSFAASVFTNRAVADQLLVAATSSTVSASALRDPLHPANAPQRKTSNQPRRKADGTTASVWTTNSLVKVLADAAAGTAQSVQISAARNEFESFQVHVRAGSNPVELTVTVGDFVNAQTGDTILSATNVFVHRAGYLNITKKSDAAGVLGMTPDPLIPTGDAYFGEARNAFPVTVSADQVQSAWIDVLVPVGARSGYYTATVTVMDGATVLAELSAELKVWAFALPSTATLKSAFGMSWNGLCVAAYGNPTYDNCAAYPGATNTDNAIHLTHVAQAKFFLDHRITISDVVYPPWGGPYNPPLDWTQFDAIYGPLLDGTAQTLLAGAKLTTIRYTTPSYRLDDVPDWISHFTSKNWLSRLFDYSCDEPGPNSNCSFQQALNRANAVHSASSSLKALVTINIEDASQQPDPGNNILAQLDIIVPIVNSVDPDDGSGNQRTSYDSWLSGPDKHLWWYQSCTSHGYCANDNPGNIPSTWPSYMVDATPVRNRVFQWLAFINRIEGELYYQVDLCWVVSGFCEVNDPWSNVWAYGGNGDGTLYYPGSTAKIGGTTPIPVSSIRLKHIRDGMEDFEYLYLLSQEGDDAFARTTAAGFITNAYTYDNNPQALADAREALGERLHQDALATPTKCPQDALVCPGGAIVTRIGPTCGFATCPPVQTSTRRPSVGR